MAIDYTVQAVYDKAIYLINEQNENTGATRTADTKEYESRTIGILNNLIDVVYPASSTYRVTEAGARPALPDIVAYTDILDLDARIVRDVLPNGLAAKLLAEENPELADYFQQLFERELATAMAQMPTEWESVDEGLPYGGIEYGEFGRWA